MTDFYPNDGWSAYCQQCDTSPNPDDYIVVTSGYEERYVCPHCGHIEPPHLSETAQLMGDFLLSVADEDWTCGWNGASAPPPRFEA